jgi:hypothetical protein
MDDTYYLTRFIAKFKALDVLIADVHRIVLWVNELHQDVKELKDDCHFF